MNHFSIETIQKLVHFPKLYNEYWILIILGECVCTPRSPLRKPNHIGFKFGSPSRRYSCINHRHCRGYLGISVGQARLILLLLFILCWFRRHVQYRSLFCSYYRIIFERFNSYCRNATYARWWWETTLRFCISAMVTAS